MNGVCGKYQRFERSVHGGHGHALRATAGACALWTAIAALALPAVGAAAQPPSPQQLWRQYPLDTKPSGGGSSRTTGATRPRSQGQPKHSGKSKQDSLMPWLTILWGACILAALAWAVSLIRQLKRRAPEPRRLESTTNGQPGVEEALRAVVRSRTYHGDRQVEPRPMSEHAVLKRKQAVATADEAEKLRQKAVVGVPRDAAVRREVSVLKAKRKGPQPAEVCHIAWSPGDEESRFVATMQKAGGKDALVSSSPPFRWNDPTPPPNNLPRAVRTHAALVHELKQRGWTTVGRGEDWYSLELQRRPSSSAREGEA